MTNKTTARIYDARGNGGGLIAPTITGDHQNRVTDYTAIVLYEKDSLLPRVDCAARRADGRHGEPDADGESGNRGGQLPIIMTYQETTGTLSPGGHPGSYNGQDAYNDMLVTEVAHGEDDCLRGRG